jgi:hypothetical protein
MQATLALERSLNHEKDKRLSYQSKWAKARYSACREVPVLPKRTDGRRQGDGGQETEATC